MRISARNRLPGVIQSVKLGGVMAQVTIKVGENELTAVITRDAAEELDLKAGDNVTALVKATEVMVEVSDSDGDR